ncbi:MAG: YraN family protein [Gemmatimonadetes bacterium]|nr:YraN family protein [Gemmatimonadota bacterium]
MEVGLVHEEARPLSDRETLGRRGEDLAARLLRGAGYRILSRNWRAGRYEIDLVGARGGEVVFVEVKTRRPGPQAAAESVTPAQRRNIGRAAAAWMRMNPTVGRSFRFDVIAVTWPENGGPRVQYIPGAFDAHGP